MLGALLKAVAQLGDPPIRRVLFISIGGAVLVMIGLWIAAGAGLAAVPETWLSDLPRWVQWIILGSGWFAAFFLSWLMFPLLVTAVMGCFLDPVLHAVEAKHYPNLPPARPQSLREVVGESVNFFLLTLVVNVIALPLYLLLPGLNFFLFLLINGFLLGREYFDMVALRRLDRAAVAGQRRQYQGQILRWGACLAVLLLVPVVNLLAPVLAAAMMVHLYQARMAGSSDA